ncbi:uncharacterized protein LOC131172506 [Hevea brasiliensis]|uniref:uncharacterized protein LOC131172506 n=1 Tax=Hevea brasiliensis TaxID=3981 RepID=UPI0025D1AE6C|nr:uncharacterized protein LOC131172506 [Hevea brasiliensis]
MTQRYYLLNGYNDVNLRHTYIASLPEALQQELHRSIAATRRAMNAITIGEIHQMTLACLDKMCEQQKLFKDIIDNSKALKNVFQKSHLAIKCKEKNCECRQEKKGHYKKYSSRFKPPDKQKKGRRTVRYFRRKRTGTQKSDRCYVCGNRGHYAKNCPKNPNKAVKLLQHIQQASHVSLENDDVESLFSEQEEPDEDTVFALGADTGSEQDHSFSSGESSSNTEAHYPSYLAQHIQSSEPIYGPDTILIPLVPLHILPSKYERPISVIGFLDTEAHKSMMNLAILPSEVIGSDLPDKDLLIGFDLYQQAKHLKILPTGLKYKRNFQPFTSVPRLYSLADASAEFQEHKELLLRSCVDSHAHFHHRHPLWQNPDFFVNLPFKLNEDINPMKAFYVEKRSERLRGKKRLVIDYKPLNHFLQDDKFPLPKPEALFTQLHEAHVFSKFDLKAGFWQLGINPANRLKTAFCIPTAQYQWTVLPFGLKTAPSVFQKAMTRIFEPFLHSALIYIDDILLFSKDVTAHRTLLLTFQQLVDSYGIMLSEKKSSLAQTDIDFLGMKLKDGKYQPGPHIAEELLKFPDKNLIVKQIQQFLGIINYIRKFIPHVATHTCQLSKMLKKNAPPWKEEQTHAVKALKEVALNPPPLKIPSIGHRVLQTDASDTHWGIVLIEEIQGEKHICEHASGEFPEPQKHYHSVYKEILAVKNGIKRFEFHLIGHHFTVVMDSSSFPKVLDFKNKSLPEPQLLRLKY